MAVLPIVTYPDPRLTTPCAPAVLDDTTRALAADMLETMYAAPGRGLAAPQVGVLIRLFVMDTGWKDGTPAPRVMVNPQIVRQGADVAPMAEGCLSIPGITAVVTRPTDITLRWTDLDGTVQEQDLTGIEAICAQHEQDHLDGILTLDRLDPVARAQALAELA